MSWPAMALGTGMNLLTGYLANQQMRNTQNKVEGHLKDWRTSIDNYQDLSTDLMDIGSATNQGLRTDIRQNMMDYAGAGTRMNQRALSSGGMGGFSGIQQQNQSQLFDKVMANSEDSFQSAFMKNKQLGTSLLDSYVKNLQAYGENMAQGQIQSDSMKAGMISQLGMGMGNAAFQYGMEEQFG